MITRGQITRVGIVLALKRRCEFSVINECNTQSTKTTQPTESLPTPSPISSATMLLPRSVLFTIILSFLSLITPGETIRCADAKYKCSMRAGCGFALHSYMVECSSLISGQTNRCTNRCQHALIALISSNEGIDLVNCECEGSHLCERSKERIQVCHSAVMTATAKDTIVSCTTARWICMADQACNTALEYYHLYCRGLFHGSKCTRRCNNSLSILDRQEKAAKLRTCYCEGTEDFPCERVKFNTERYCYGRLPTLVPSSSSGTEIRHHASSNEIDLIDSSGLQQTHHGRRHNGSRHKHRTLIVTSDAAATVAVPSVTTLYALLSIALVATTTARMLLFNRSWSR